MTSALVESKIGSCPVSGIEASLVGTYEKSPDGRRIFMEASCNIFKNAQKPSTEQDPELGTVACEDPSKCPLYLEVSSRS